MVTIFTICRSI